MNLIVNIAERKLYAGEKTYDCVYGRGGALPAHEKTEGDGATPLGRWQLRRILYRPDRLDPPASTLPVIPLRSDDGWCDAPEDPLYNRPVSLPYPASHERLWREDHVYDVIVELGHNDDPVVPFRGSAVFMHMTRPDRAPTEGCIALERDDLIEVLAGTSSTSYLDIRAG